MSVLNEQLEALVHPFRNEAFGRRLNGAVDLFLGGPLTVPRNLTDWPGGINRFENLLQQCECEQQRQHVLRGVFKHLSQLDIRWLMVVSRPAQWEYGETVASFIDNLNGQLDNPSLPKAPE